MSLDCRFQNTSRTVRYDSHENFKFGLEDCLLIKKSYKSCRWPVHNPSKDRLGKNSLKLLRRPATDGYIKRLANITYADIPYISCKDQLQTHISKFLQISPTLTHLTSIAKTSYIQIYQNSCKYRLRGHTLHLLQRPATDRYIEILANMAYTDIPCISYKDQLETDISQV
jgi:hypothetical protein